MPRTDSIRSSWVPASATNSSVAIPALRLLILGYGAFGQALAMALHHRADIVVEVFSRRVPPAESPGIESVDRFIHDLRAIDLGRYDVVILALPSGALATTLDRIPRTLEPAATLLSCVKGMDAETHDFPTDLIGQHMPGHPVGMLSGPTFAGEMQAGHRVWMSLGCADLAHGTALAARLSGPLLALTPTADVRGLEIIGVAKNIVAIGAGLTEGLDLGENTRASYVARGMRELERLLPRLGGVAKTIMAPGAMGDLILTCTSAQSRNYRFGRDLGLGLRAVVAGPPPLAEGSRSILAFLAFLKRNDVESAYFEGLAAAMADPATVTARLLATID
jgi:glycerol-3-phosphate dehydrogenase (NAD(P)+)